VHVLVPRHACGSIKGVQVYMGAKQKGNGKECGQTKDDGKECGQTKDDGKEYRQEDDRKKCTRKGNECYGLT